MGLCQSIQLDEQSFASSLGFGDYFTGAMCSQCGWKVFIAFTTEIQENCSLTKCIDEKIIEWLESYRKKDRKIFKHMTLGKTLHFQRELCRSIIAHILDAPQIFSQYNPRTVEQEFVEIPTDYHKKWLDLQQFKDLKMSTNQFAHTIYDRFSAYPFETHFPTIVKSYQA